MTPCMPSARGIGWEQRAQLWLSALARFVEVESWVISLGRRPGAEALAALSQASKGGVRLVTEADTAGYRADQLRPLRAFSLKPFLATLPWNTTFLAAGRRAVAAADRVHLFRMWPSELPGLFSERRGGITCDFDIAPIGLRTERDGATARVPQPLLDRLVDRIQGIRDRRMLRHDLPRLDRIYLCSRAELQRMPALPRVRVIPNVVHPEDAVPPGPPPDPHTLLFVGNLEYRANIDGLRWFVDKVWPRVRQRLPPTRLLVVGTGPADAASFLRDPGIELHRNAESVAPFYLRATAVIAPLVSGAGTRTKVIEAFSRRRAVVATSRGVEGLEVQDGAEVLVADDPDAFAQQSVRAMQDGSLNARLTHAAYEYFQKHHSQAAVDVIVEDELRASGLLPR